MDKMTDSKAVEVLSAWIRGENVQTETFCTAVAAAIARLREPAGVGGAKEVFVRFLGVGEGGPYPVFNGVCVIPSFVARKLVASAVGEEMKREALSKWAAPQPPAEAQAQGGGEVWQHPDTLPPVESGQYGWFWVAVRRTNGRVYSFPATYLNAMVLADENGDQEESRGNRYHHGPVDQDDGTFEATGWHDAKEHSEYSAIYLPLLDSDKDELIAWRSVADYGDTAPPSAPVHGCAEQVHDGNWDSDAAAIGGLHAPSAPVGVEALTEQFIAAVAADEAGEGSDPAAGLIGPAVSAWLRSLAQQPAAVEGETVSRIVDAIVSHPMNETDTDTLRRCVTEALRPTAAQENDDA